MRISIVTCFICLCLLQSGCTNEDASRTANIGGKVCQPLEYGNGVLYFPCTKATFGNALALYVGSGMNTRVTSVAPDDTGTYGYTVGYFVTTEHVPH